MARDSDRSDSWLTVAFATSDLTARGVDSDAYKECSELPVAARVPVSRVDTCALYTVGGLDHFVFAERHVRRCLA